MIFVLYYLFYLCLESRDSRHFIAYAIIVLFCCSIAYRVLLCSALERVIHLLSAICSSDVLGTFKYDPTQFEVVLGQRRIYLHYIGSEIDGSCIKIPIGLKSAYRLFCGCGIVYPPQIPYGVTDCSSAFRDCRELKEPPKFPSSVVCLNHALDGCVSLRKPPLIAGTILYFDGIFKGCVALELPAVLPLDGKPEEYEDSIYEGCTTLERVYGSLKASVLNEVEKNSFVISYDGSLGSFEYDTREYCIEYCEEFSYLHYCGEASRGIVLPEGLVDASRVFQDCYWVLEPPELPESVRRMDYAFENCFFLQSQPFVHGAVDSCDCAFSNCFCLKENLYGERGNCVYRGCQSVEYTNFRVKWIGGWEIYYKGFLGEFVFDYRQFTFRYWDGEAYLKYRGDGYGSVVIPYGIKSYYRMFDDSSKLHCIPIAPDTIVDFRSGIKNEIDTLERWERSNETSIRKEVQH